MSTLAKKVDMVGFITVRNSNPNGDLDMENKPRQDAEGFGMITSECLKRTMKDNAHLLYSGAPGYDLYIQPDGIALDTKVSTEGLSIEGADKMSPQEYGQALKSKLCEKYFDVRAFGAAIVGLNKIKTDGAINGPVCVTYAESLEPIDPMEISITRVSIQTEKDAAKKTTEIGKKWIVPYAVYRFEVHVSPSKASKTGFSNEDLTALIESIRTMFDNNRSAAKSDIELTKLFVFEHNSELGCCPSTELNSLIRVSKVSPDFGRDFYDITIDEANIPEGVTLLK